MPAVDEQVEDLVDETPEVNDTVEDVAEEPVETPAPVAESNFLDQVSELGFEGVETEDQAKERLLTSYQQSQSELEQLRQQAEQNFQLATYGNEYLNLMRDGKLPQDQAETEPAAQDESWWTPPEFDQSLADRYQETAVNPETGETTVNWADGTPADVRSGFEAHQQYIDKWADDLVHRPHQVIPKIIDHEVNRILDARLAERDTQMESERFAERVQQENASWLFEADPRTNTARIDPITRQPILTEDGKAVMAYADQAAEIGIADPRAQWEYATSMRHRDILSEQFDAQGVATTVAQKAVDKKMEHLKRGAAAGRSRGGSASTAAETGDSQNPNLSVKEKLRDQMITDGLIS